jgi:hypothetical protein
MDKVLSADIGQARDSIGAPAPQRIGATALALAQIALRKGLVILLNRQQNMRISMMWLNRNGWG